LSELIIRPGSPHGDKFSETLSKLAQKGWLLQNDATDSYKLHLIMAQALRQQQAIVEDDVHDLLIAVSMKLWLDQAKDNPVDKFVWIPYGKALLDALPEDLSSMIAVLANNLALRIRDLGDLAGAKTLLEFAVRLDEKDYGPDDPITSIKYGNLANVLRALGEYENSITTHEKTIRINEKNFGLEDTRTAIAYSNLATVLLDVQEFDRARSLLEKAIKINEKDYGPDHAITAIAYSNLALALSGLGEYQDARSLLEKAVQSDETNFGADHPSTALKYNNLASVLNNMSKYELALAYAEKALNAAKNCWPAGHSEIRDAATFYESIKSKISEK
jgi:tetratricopeptide (TPR) repeat protein